MKKNDWLQTELQRETCHHQKPHEVWRHHPGLQYTTRITTYISSNSVIHWHYRPLMKLTRFRPMWEISKETSGVFIKNKSTAFIRNIWKCNKLMWNIKGDQNPGEPRKCSQLTQTVFEDNCHSHPLGFVHTPCCTNIV